MFRSISKITSYTDLKLHIPDFDVLTFKIKENSIYHSKTLKDLDLRQKFQLNILAIKREEEIISNPNPESKFITNDIVILFGNRENLRKFEVNI